uniref:G-protein coupled receptors family 1 profile domain-containing protein n=1 Tax=Ciona savignyi TaxID=51511 RepID=H2YL95_CIOSA
MNGSENATDFSHATQQFRYLGITIGMIDIVLGTSGNLLTILAVGRNRDMRRNSFNMLIVNLAIIDLLTASVMMPFNVMGYILMDWPLGTTTCILQAFFYFSCGYTSVVCLIAITLNRLIGVVLPSRYTSIFTDQNVRIVIFICWILAPAFLLPYLIVSLLRHYNNQLPITGWNQKQFLCTFVNLSQPHLAAWDGYMKATRAMFQFVPTIIMVISYTVMVYYVKKSNKRFEASRNPGYNEYRLKMLTRDSRQSSETNISLQQSNHESGQHQNEINPTQTRRVTRSASVLSRISTFVWKADSPRQPFRTRSPSQQERHLQEKHLVYLSIIICVTFNLLFLPSLIVSFLKYSDPRPYMAASNVTWFNSCVNPVIYVIMHKGMRHEYKKLIKKICSAIRNCCVKKTTVLTPAI